MGKWQERKEELNDEGYTIFPSCADLLVAGKNVPPTVPKQNGFQFVSVQKLYENLEGTIPDERKLCVEDDWDLRSPVLNSG